MSPIKVLPPWNLNTHFWIMYVFWELISPFNCSCHTFHKCLQLFWRSYHMIALSPSLWCVLSQSCFSFLCALVWAVCPLTLCSVCRSLSQEYQGASVLGQFVTRFMLRETSSQLLSLQRSLQCAMEAVEEQSSPAPLVHYVIQYFVFSVICYILFNTVYILLKS